MFRLKNTVLKSVCQHWTGNGLCNCDISSHIYFNNLEVDVEKVVPFNGEHVRAHPKTCGFGGTL